MFHGSVFRHNDPQCMDVRDMALYHSKAVLHMQVARDCCWLSWLSRVQITAGNCSLYQRFEALPQIAGYDMAQAAATGKQACC